MGAQRFIGIAMVAMAASGIGACGGDGGSGAGGGGGTGGGSEPSFVEPSAETQAVWADIEGYASWPKFPENEEPKKSAAHENMLVVTYYNDAVGAAMESGELPLPDGSILVKDHFAKAGEPTMALTIMAKRGGNWYWVKARPDGKVFAGPDGQGLEGTGVAMCTGCHDGAKSNDYVYTHAFTQ